MMGYGGWGAMAGFGGLGMIAMLLFWVGLVVLVVWAAGRLFSTQGQGAQETPLEILKRRYARGEITQAEYQQAGQDLA